MQQLRLLVRARPESACLDKGLTQERSARDRLPVDIDGLMNGTLSPWIGVRYKNREFPGLGLARFGGER